jgi:hypothetical protein
VIGKRLFQSSKQKNKKRNGVQVTEEIEGESAVDKSTYEMNLVGPGGKSPRGIRKRLVTQPPAAPMASGEME